MMKKYYPAPIPDTKMVVSELISFFLDKPGEISMTNAVKTRHTKAGNVTMGWLGQPWKQGETV